MFAARPGGLQRILTVMGIVLFGYGFMEWYQLEKPSDAEVALRVEIMYLAEVQRLQKSPTNNTGEPITLSPDWQAKYRQAIRNDVVAPYEHKRKQAASFMFAGGAMLFMMGSGFFANWLANRASRPK